MNSNMITNNTVWTIQQFILYFTFSSSEFVDIVLVTFADIVFIIFVGIVFVPIVDTLSVAFTILSHTITESSFF